MAYLKEHRNKGRFEWSLFFRLSGNKDTRRCLISIIFILVLLFDSLICVQTKDWVFSWFSIWSELVYMRLSVRRCLLKVRKLQQSDGQQTGLIDLNYTYTELAAYD